MKDNKVGALWKNESKNGKTYYSGTINNEKVVVFENGYKETDKHPDLIVYKSEPLEEKPKSKIEQDKETLAITNEDLPF